MAAPKDGVSLRDLGQFISETDMFKAMNNQMNVQSQYEYEQAVRANELAARRQMEQMQYLPQHFYDKYTSGAGALMGGTSITTAPSPDAATILLREEKLKLAKELGTAKARIVEQEDIIAELVNLLASVKSGETEVEVAESIPIDIVTDSPTFEHGGKTWFHYTATEDAKCPVDGEVEIQVILRQDNGEYRGNHHLAKYYEWGKLGVEYGIDGALEIVAYRVADE